MNLVIKKKIKPTIKIINDNNLEISLILYPRKIIEELNNKNKIKGDIVFLWNFLFIKWCKCVLSGLKIDFLFINLLILTKRKS